MESPILECALEERRNGMSGQLYKLHMHIVTMQKKAVDSHSTTRSATIVTVMRKVCTGYWTSKKGNWGWVNICLKIFPKQAFSEPWLTRVFSVTCFITSYFPPSPCFLVLFGFNVHVSWQIIISMRAGTVSLFIMTVAKKCLLDRTWPVTQTRTVCW